jgi:hypothetical protein
MKMMILTAVMLVALTVTGWAADAGVEKKKGKRTGAVKHMVAFKFKEGASKDDIEKVEREFKGLKKKIDVIRTLDWGHNNSPENLNKGFTHGWVLTFDSEEDRNTYLHHPEHEKFATLAKATIADVFVLDFTSGK